jgi:hypothetical protein
MMIKSRKPQFSSYLCTYFKFTPKTNQSIISVPDAFHVSQFPSTAFGELLEGVKYLEGVALSKNAAVLKSTIAVHLSAIWTFSQFSGPFDCQGSNWTGTIRRHGHLTCWFWAFRIRDGAATVDSAFSLG